MNDLRLVALECFRYSLGRKTYIPFVITNFIKKNQSIFNREDWKNFIIEINECDDLGMECNKQIWEDFKSFCRSKNG
jgi:hypothetical protein